MNVSDQFQDPSSACGYNMYDDVFIPKRVDYINKVEVLLSDVTKFSKLDVDTLDICQKREKRLVHFLRGHLAKTENQY